MELCEARDDPCRAKALQPELSLSEKQGEREVSGLLALNSGSPGDDPELFDLSSPVSSPIQ